MNKQTLVKVALAGMLLLPALAFAQSSGVTTPGPIGTGNLCDIIRHIEDLIWMIFGLIAVISFVVAGVLFLTSQGDAERVAAARSAFVWGVAGVVVGIIAFSIVAIVASGIGSNASIC